MSPTTTVLDPMITPPQPTLPPVIAIGSPLIKTVDEPEAMVRGWGELPGLV
ncbi:hypothetical protein D3C85_1804330 [compost metagenome]